MFEELPEEISEEFINKRRNTSIEHIKIGFHPILIEYMTDRPDDVRIRGKRLFEMLISNLINQHFHSYVKHVDERSLNEIVVYFNNKYYDTRTWYNETQVPHYAAIDYGH